MWKRKKPQSLRFHFFFFLLTRERSFSNFSRYFLKLPGVRNKFFSATVAEVGVRGLARQRAEIEVIPVGRQQRIPFDARSSTYS